MTIWMTRFVLGRSMAPLSPVRNLGTDAVPPGAQDDDGDGAQEDQGVAR